MKLQLNLPKTHNDHSLSWSVSREKVTIPNVSYAEASFPANFLHLYVEETGETYKEELLSLTDEVIVTVAKRLIKKKSSDDESDSIEARWRHLHDGGVIDIE